jgi:hypothetical protein
MKVGPAHAAGFDPNKKFIWGRFRIRYDFLPQFFSRTMKNHGAHFSSPLKAGVPSPAGFALVIVAQQLRYG